MAFTGILRFWQTYKNLARIRQIVNVFLRHGFGQFIEQLNLTRFLPLRKRLRILRRWEIVEHHTIPQRLRMAFSELGPSFIKLAQILSSRPDLITVEFANEFKKLQDRVPPFPTVQAKRIIEEELGVKINDIFQEFEDSPVAAASIAQVHRARLKNGKDVIVKIQRPGIRDILETDILILGAIARLILKYIPESKYFDPEGIVHEFARTVRKELDFLAEAKNARRFRRIFEDDKNIHIPAVFPEYTTSKVLVMERIDGVRIDDIDALDSMGIDRKELAMKGVNAYFKMIFEHGFFHADPHPGNIFVMDDGRIGLVDFGIVGWLTPEMIEYLAEAFMAIINKDYDRIVDIYIDLGLVSEKMDIDVFRREFRSDIAYLLEPLYDITISEVDFSEYVEALMRLIVKHHLKVPSDLLLMNRTILIVDNIGRALDPDFNIISAARPYAAELIKKRLSPERMLSKARDSLIEVGDLLIDTPRQVNRLVKKTLRDEVTIKIDPVGMERLILDIDRSSNRIAFSLVVAAIIIGSSMLVQSDIGGKIFGLSTVGATGFLIAFILGLRLLISILKSGRL